MGLGSMRVDAPPKPKKGVAERREEQICAFVGALGARVEVGVVRPMGFDEAAERDRKRIERGESRVFTREVDGILQQVKGSVGFWKKGDRDADSVISIAADLARRNAQENAAIYWRISLDGDGWHPGTIVIDDIDRDGIEELRAEGLDPCAVVETSPNNFQAIVRLSETPMHPALAQRVALELNHGLGDPAASNARQPGRLPGFTNGKPEHRQPNGRAPFVGLVQAPGMVASRGAEWLEEFTEHAETSGLILPPDRFKARRMKAEAVLSKDTVRGEFNATDDQEMDALMHAAKRKCAQQVMDDERHPAAHSASEWAFNAAVAGLRKGFGVKRIERWLEASMSAKRQGTDYARRTAANAWSYFKDPNGFYTDRANTRFNTGSGSATHFPGRHR